MSKNEFATELDMLSRHLFKIHKSLIEFQKQIYENLENKKTSPYEMLHLLMNHGDFEWLRQISTIMVYIDEAVDNKKTPPDSDTVVRAKNELRSLFFNPDVDTDFMQKLVRALEKDMELKQQLSALKNLLLP